MNDLMLQAPLPLWSIRYYLGAQSQACLAPYLSASVRPFLGLELSQASELEKFKSVKGEKAFFCFYTVNLHFS